MYIGFRADEERKGNYGLDADITYKYPFVEDGIDLEGVYKILKDNEIELPDFYRWRTTGGCYFCPFQRRSDWMGLKRNHPDLFAEAKRLEEKHGHGTFTWNQLYSLEEIEAQRELVNADGSPLEIEERDLDEFEDKLPCAICAK